MRDLLQRLQGALPQMAAWIDELHHRHRLVSVSANELGLPRVSQCFPVSLLDHTRAAIVDTIPFPPVSQFGLPEFEPMAVTPKAGITFGSMYFVHESHASESVHFHELVHVLQWQTLGVAKFLSTYAVGLALHGYEASPLEAMAFGLQRAFESHAACDSLVDDIVRETAAAHASARDVFRAHGLEIDVESE
jgi:hypothetical protein